ncbi:Zn(2+)-responsive transcriptional regulator [bacterium]|nr:Zn(2+)-responsive transcriptional regulator [bacterium]
MSKDNSTVVTIGGLAKASGLPVSTLRYYERQGLLRPSRRSASGYRHYDDSAVAQLAFIQQAKAIGFQLQEIIDLLAINVDKQSSTCAEVKQFVDRKYEDTLMHLSKVEAIAHALKQLSDACCGGAESAEHGTILSALNKSGRHSMGDDEYELLCTRQKAITLMQW